jgi:hypothetical protein
MVRDTSQRNIETDMIHYPCDQHQGMKDALEAIRIELALAREQRKNMECRLGKLDSIAARVGWFVILGVAGAMMTLVLKGLK